MGKRGPGAGRLRAAAKKAPAKVKHPWEKRRMPPDEKVLAFLRTLPIVSGLKAGGAVVELPLTGQVIENKRNKNWWQAPEVETLILSGKPDKDIAAALGITPAYVGHLRYKMRIQNKQ